MSNYNKRFPLRFHTWYRNQEVTDNTTNTGLLIGKRTTSGRLAHWTRNMENSGSNSKGDNTTVEHSVGNNLRGIDKSTQTVNHHVT